MDRVAEMDGPRPRRSTWLNAEPAIFLFAVSFGVLMSASPLAVFWLRCIQLFEEDSAGGRGENLKNATEYCARISLGNSTTLLDRVERDVAEAQIYLQAFSTGATLLSAPLFGAWSDYNGRKTPLVVTLTGATFYLCTMALGIHFYAKTSIYFFMGTAEVVAGLLGISSLFTLTASIVADDCRERLEKANSGIPPRMAIACAIQAGGFLLGSAVNQFFSVPLTLDGDNEGHVDGYLRAMAFASLSALASLIYTLLFVRETHTMRVGQRQRMLLNEASEGSTETLIAPIDAPPPSSTAEHELSFRKYFPLYMAGAFRVLVLKRPGWIRLCLVLTVLAIFVEASTFNNQLFLLVMKRQPFDWDDSTYTRYVTAQTLVGTAGTALSPLVLSLTCGSKFAGSESLLLIVALGANALATFMLALAGSTQQIFLILPLCAVAGGMTPAFRTVLVKMVSKEQTARLFSMVTLLMALCPLASRALFNKIYQQTLDTWPMFVFLIMAALYTCAVGTQTLVHFLMRPLWIAQNEQGANENPRDIEETASVQVTEDSGADSDGGE